MRVESCLKGPALLAAALLAVQVMGAGVPSAWGAETSEAEGLPELKTQREKASYAIGIEIARNFKRQKIDLDPDLVSQGLKDTLAGKKLLLTDQEHLVAMNFFGNDMTRKRVRDKRIAGLDNKKAGEEFLAANRKAEGVITLPSGLQYRVIKMGDGSKPTENDTVACRYRGVLIDGTEFENTFHAPTPGMITLSDLKVIPGVREALKLMPVGSKWELFIPPQMAYAGQGFGQEIGPNATLIYELELIAITPGPEKLADLGEVRQQ